MPDERGGDATTYFLYHGRQLSAEIDDSGRVTAQYVYFQQVPLVKLEYTPQQINGPNGEGDGKQSSPSFFTRLQVWLGWIQDSAASRIYAIHTDHLGTPRLATDSQQQVVWQASYTAFGKASVQTERITLNLRLPGQYFDRETGTHYNYFRDYDPETGRYLTSDPIGLAGGINTYAYASGNPLSEVDLLGLKSFVKDGRIYIKPEDFMVPTFDMPNTVDAVGVKVSSINFHAYNVVTPSLLNRCQVQQGLKNNPTPGVDAPASISGTVNDVGPILTVNIPGIGPIYPLGKENKVRSFYIESPNPFKWTNITVNYTVAGQHALNEGFVIRFGEIRADGTVIIRSYGEGDAAQQNEALGLIWLPQVESVWQQNHQQIISAAKK